jgi:AhpD family alkylhydroperoxidase
MGCNFVKTKHQDKMQTSFNIAHIEPNAYKAMLAFSKYSESTDLSPIHRELIKIRASQINGCAHCLNMHTRDARKLGETEQRIYLLNAWRETTLYSEAEQAILALTEEITLINQHVSDDTYNKAVQVLGEQYTAQVMMTAIIINGWNRIAIATNLLPEA